MQSFEDYAQAELVAARADLKRLPVQQAVVKFYTRQDAAIRDAASTAGTSPACKAGCAYCCYYKVEARAAEVLAIKNFAVSRFSPVQLPSRHQAR
jgi:hypothetical protein